MTERVYIELHIQGQPPRKSNNRRIVVNRRTGRPSVIKSQAALDWVKSALLQIPASAKQGVGSKDHPLCISFWVRYATRSPDLSVELILDVLQEAGVIADDRYVFEYHSYKAIDRENPGVDIIVEEIKE